MYLGYEILNSSFVQLGKSFGLCDCGHVVQRKLKAEILQLLCLCQRMFCFNLLV